MTRNLRAEATAADPIRLLRKIKPVGTQIVDGVVLTGKTRARQAETRERRRDAMYALMEAHPESAEELYGRAAQAQKSAPLVSGKLLRTVRKAERVNGDGEQIAGTGLTALKFKVNGHPLAKLIDEHKLVPEAVTAADEIHTAFHAIASRMMIRPGCLERIDGRGRGDMPWPAKISRSVSNYQAFARHWTKRAGLGDPMLEVLIAVVIDERSIRDVSEGVSVGHRRFGHIRIKRAVIAGLQDYAARAESIAKNLPSGWAARWMDEAERVFPVRPVEVRIPEAVLRQAVSAAREAM